MPAGRPTKYDPDTTLPILESLGDKGESRTQMASALGICRDTLYRWMEEHPDFSDAVKAALERSQGAWESTLWEQANGVVKNGSAAAAIFAMKNQFRDGPDGYKDRHDHDIDARVGTFEINYQGTNYDGHYGGDQEDS